jgi:hypothetical protein
MRSAYTPFEMRASSTSCVSGKHARSDVHVRSLHAEPHQNEIHGHAWCRARRSSFRTTSHTQPHGGARAPLIFRFPGHDARWGGGKRKTYRVFFFNQRSLTYPPKKGYRKNKHMPLPLSFALWGLRSVRQYHSAPNHVRPTLLRRVLYARMGAYSTALLVVAAIPMDQQTV